MNIEIHLPSGLDRQAYEGAARAAREAAVLRLFETHVISAGRAAEELRMALEDFLLWASAHGVSVLEYDGGDLAREADSALGAARTDA